MTSDLFAEPFPGASHSAGAASRKDSGLVLKHAHSLPGATSSQDKKRKALSPMGRSYSGALQVIADGRVATVLPHAATAILAEQCMSCLVLCPWQGNLKCTEARSLLMRRSSWHTGISAQGHGWPYKPQQNDIQRRAASLLEHTAAG